MKQLGLAITTCMVLVCLLLLIKYLKMSKETVTGNAMKIHRFAKLGDIEGVARELESGVSVDAIDISSNFTPLMYAATSSAAGVDIVRYLIAHGADINASGGDYDKSPVVWHAAKGMNIDKIRFLIDSGADKEQLKWAKLMEAVIYGSVDEVKSVIDGGCDLFARDCWGRTAWLLSIQVGDIAKSKLLLEAGSNRGDKGHCGKTPLMYAISNERLDMLRWLLDEGFDIEDRDEFSSTALIQACENGYTDCVKILLEHGADINATNASGKALTEIIADIDEELVGLAENVDRFKVIDGIRK